MQKPVRYVAQRSDACTAGNVPMTKATVAMIMCGRPHSRRIVGNSTCASHVYKDTGTKVKSRPP